MIFLKNRIVYKQIQELFLSTFPSEDRPIVLPIIVQIKTKLTCIFNDCVVTVTDDFAEEEYNIDEEICFTEFTNQLQQLIEDRARRRRNDISTHINHDAEMFKQYPIDQFNYNPIIALSRAIFDILDFGRKITIYQIKSSIGIC